MISTKRHTIPIQWSYNPSSWNQRIPVLILAFIGFCIATYLGLYQLHVFKTVWEPFFSKGSIHVLNSKISKILPVPDALLGAFGYLVDFVTGIIGGENRWQKKPWIVIIFGLAVGPLGMVSILLVILQPIVLHSWCTLCLTSALISVLMIGPAMDEFLASLQYLKRKQLEGCSVWQAFLGIEK